MTKHLNCVNFLKTELSVLAATIYEYCSTSVGAENEVGDYRCMGKDV